MSEHIPSEVVEEAVDAELPEMPETSEIEDVVEEPVDTAFKTSITSGNVPENDIVAQRNEKRDGRRVSLSTFGYPINVTAEWTKGKHPVLDPETFSATTFHHMPLTVMESRMSGGEWTTTVQHAGTKIKHARPQFGGDLKGQAAVELVRRRSGSGTSIIVPLFRSGIWVTMRPATEDEIANLDYQLSFDEAAVGRSTAGTLLDAGAGTFAGALVDLALKLVINTNVASFSGDMVNALRERIDVMDYTDLISAMLISLYPDGYPWDFTCSNPKCNHVVADQRVNFSRMLWHDRSLLNEKQLDMLVKRKHSITDDEIEAYKSEFKLTDKDHVHLKDSNMIIHFRTCSLGEYLRNSSKWIRNIENKYTTSLTKFHTEEQRAQFINTQVQINRYGKYLHIVDHISFPDIDDIIDDRDTIEMVLADQDSTSPDYLEFEDAAMSYIEANTISVFGYPSQPCKACGVEPETPDGHLSIIVPVAPDRTFFTLAQLKTMAMAELGSE